jgi:hypothetical protein
LLDVAHDVSESSQRRVVLWAQTPSRQSFYE